MDGFRARRREGLSLLFPLSLSPWGPARAGHGKGGPTVQRECSGRPKRGQDGEKGRPRRTAEMRTGEGRGVTPTMSLPLSLAPPLLLTSTCDTTPAASTRTTRRRMGAGRASLPPEAAWEWWWRREEGGGTGADALAGGGGRGWGGVGLRDPAAAVDTSTVAGGGDM